MPDTKHLLSPLAPDPAAQQDARTFHAMLPDAPRIRGRLEDLCMSFAYFTRAPGPHSEGLAAALAVLSFAASGLAAFLEDPEGDAWGTLARARLWAVLKQGDASADLPLSATEDFRHALDNPHMLPRWAAQVGDTKEAGKYTVWLTAAYLLEAVPSLEDGEAEGTLDAVLSALAQPVPLLPSSPDGLALIAEGVALMQEAQHVEDLPGGRVRVCMGGGEDYEVGRANVALTPLLDGAAFLAVFIGTPDAVTVRLSPSDARHVSRALGLPGEGEDGQASPLN